MHLLFTDGGSRGNPGPSGAGFVLCESNGKVLHKEGRFLGVCTNNVAEYKALLLGLEYVISQEIHVLYIYMDSQLIVRQIQGVYQVKNPELKQLFLQVQNYLHRIGEYQFFYISREKNTLADRMVNMAIDDAIGKPMREHLLF